MTGLLKCLYCYFHVGTHGLGALSQLCNKTNEKVVNCPSKTMDLKTFCSISQVAQYQSFNGYVHASQSLIFFTKLSWSLDLFARLTKPQGPICWMYAYINDP